MPSKEKQSAPLTCCGGGHLTTTTCYTMLAYKVKLSQFKQSLVRLGQNQRLRESHLQDTICFPERNFLFKTNKTAKETERFLQSCTMDWITSNTKCRRLKDIPNIQFWMRLLSRIGNPTETETNVWYCLL